MLYANNKASAFSRVAEYLDQDKRLILYNTFIMSDFNYCPLIWMFCGKDANVSQRIMWQDIAAPFAELLVPWVPEPRHLDGRKLVRGKERRKKGSSGQMITQPRFGADQRDYESIRSPFAQ